MTEETQKTMKELPVSEQPYEKARAYGTESLSDAELLAVILRTGSRNLTARELAEKLLTMFDQEGLSGLMHHSAEEFQSIRGIGEVKAIQLMAVGELSKRIWKRQASSGEPYFRSPEVIADFYMEEMRHLEQEHLRMMILNTKNSLIKEIEISKGTVNMSVATPRELFIEALRYRGTGIVLVHNHPSGDPAPSREDCIFTKQIVNAGKIIGIPLLDHIIIGDNVYTSLRERGII